MKTIYEEPAPLSTDELDNVTGGASARTLDLRSFRVQMSTNESAKQELAALQVKGIPARSHIIHISDPNRILDTAGHKLDENIAVSRSCVVTYTLDANQRIATVTNVVIE